MTAIAAVAAMAACSLSAASAEPGADPDEVPLVSDLVSISPARSEHEIAPGRSDSLELTVANGTQEPLVVVLEPTHLCVPDEPDLLARACEASPLGDLTWLRLANDTLRVEPDQRSRTQLSIEVPADGRPGAHAFGVRTYTRGARPEGTGVQVQSSALTQILVNVPGDAVAAIDVEPNAPPRFVESGATVRFEATVSNIGDTIVSGSGELELDAFLATASQQLDVALPHTLPGGSRTVGARWAETPLFGTFTPELTIEFADGDQESARFPRVWVLPPWWFWVALAAALLLPTVARRRRRRRHR